MYLKVERNKFEIFFCLSECYPYLKETMAPVAAAACLAAALLSYCNGAHVKLEKLKEREGFVLKERAHADLEHEVIFHVKQLNMDVLEKIVEERSSPNHVNYQKWLSFEEVGSLISNSVGAERVIEWLNDNHIEVYTAFALGAFPPFSLDIYLCFQIVSKTINQDFITAKTSVGKWETVFDTKFYSWQDTHPENMNTHRVIRAKEYSLPDEIASHVEAVFNTVQVPPVIPKRFHRAEDNKVSSWKDTRSPLVMLSCVIFLRRS